MGTSKNNAPGVSGGAENHVKGGRIQRVKSSLAESKTFKNMNYPSRDVVPEEVKKKGARP